MLFYPSAPFPASYHYSAYLRPFNFSYWGLFNVLKFPVCQVPLGLDEQGLPVGIQVSYAYIQKFLYLFYKKNSKILFTLLLFLSNKICTGCFGHIHNSKAGYLQVLGERQMECRSPRSRRELPGTVTDSSFGGARDVRAPPLLQTFAPHLHLAQRMQIGSLSYCCACARNTLYTFNFCYN